MAGEAALYFDPSSAAELGHAIMNLTGDEQLRRDLIDRGRQRAKMFSPARLADKHLKAFSEASDTFRRSEYFWKRWVLKYINITKLLSKIIGNTLLKKGKQLLGYCSGSKVRPS